MKKLYWFKYKIYKKFHSEIWGLVILKNKKNNLFKFILKNFVYLLRKFYRRTYLKNFNIYLKSEPLMLKSSLKNKFLFDKFKKKSFNKLFYKNLKLTAAVELKKLFLKNVYRLFWLKYYNIYNYLSIINNFRFTQQFYSKKVTEFSTSAVFFHIYVYKKLFLSIRKKKKLFSRFLINKQYFFKRSIYSHIYLDQFYKKNIYIKKKKSQWWTSKIIQSRANVFFGFFNKLKFLKFQEYCFFSNKLRFFWILKFVGRVCFVFFNLNFFNDMYYIHNLIKKGCIQVDGKMVFNPNYSLGLFQNITISKNYFFKLYFLLKFRLKNNQIFFNKPAYLEVNYKILTASIWRYPKPSEIIGPYDFPFRTFSLDWLLYKRKFSG